MSPVNTDVTALVDGRDYSGILPSGIQVWQAQARVTGDGTAGNQSITVQFNPQSDVGFQPYVSVSLCGIQTQVAALVGGIQVVAADNHWERSVGTQMILKAFQPVLTLSATVKFAGVDHEIAYVGRGVKGQSLDLIVQFLEVDTMIADIDITGLISDHPFIPYDYWRV